MRTLAVLALLSSCATLPPPPEKPTVKLLAQGTFEVKLAPLPADPGRPQAFPRLSIDKTFAGELEGTSQGEMTASSMAPGGSGAYVALEQVTGTVAGKTGTFVLVHRGLMHAGWQELKVLVVPGSGTGQLEGLTGELAIRIEGGKHFYRLEGTLP